jgi:hypothetical protein
MLFLTIFGMISIMFIYGALSWGFTTLCFYNWFIYPVFTSLPMIGYSEAVGIGLFIFLFNTKPVSFGVIDPNAEENGSKNIEQILNFLTPWVVCLLGKIIYVFFVK